MRLKGLVRFLACCGLGIGVWEGLIVVLRIPPYLLPHLSQVVVALHENFDHLLVHLGKTLAETALGGGAGISLGLAVGVGLAVSEKARWLLEPYLLALQSFPREALAPLFVVWFGFGLLPKVVLAAMICFFPMALATLTAVSSTPSELVKLIRAQGGGEVLVLLYVRLPHAVPGLLAGLRVALPLAVIGAVIGELMGGSRGLGYVIATSGAQMRTPLMFAALVMLGLVGACMLGIVRIAERAVGRRFLNYIEGSAR